MARSPAIDGAILRGIGAYLRAVSKNDLPPSLRTFHGKHQKMLAARRGELLQAFDDDATLRALIAQWLDDDAPLPKRDAEVLRIAAERTEGWEQRLNEAQPEPARRAPKKERPPDEGLAREREKTRKARDEARRAKDDAEQRIERSEKERRRLTERVGELGRRVEELEHELRHARQEATKARGDAERAERKARRATEDAGKEVRALRKEISSLKTALERTRADGSRPKAGSEGKASRGTVTTQKEPAKRRQLAVPKGRFEDAPETLTEWLGADGVHLLVDGYNVSKAVGGFGDLALADQRQRLVDELGRLARRHGIKATIVFDGSDVPPGTRRRNRSPVAVEYSSPNEIADDHLIARLETLPRHPVVVVTNDRELQDRARAEGATIATSNQLLGLIR